jgi:tripartite-type tricarboxylate transporter receptor subunit TctC
MRHLAGWVVAAVVAAAVAPAQAQTYPSRFVTVILPFSAGSPGDVFIRIVAAGLSAELGQQVVVENIGGAGGTTGVGRAAKAAPDGYTMVLASAGTHAGAAAFYPNLGYHPADSFDSIALIGTTPIAIVSRPAIPAKTLQEFIAYLRANEKTVTEATAGVGSTSHVTCAFFRSLIGVRPTAVPFRGTSDATQAILGGSVDYICNQLPVTVEHVKAGTLRAYAMTGEKRSALLPDVPTMAEAGLPAFDAVSWLGLQFPKGTSPAIIEKMTAALNKVVEQEETRTRLIAQGIDIAPRERRTPAWLDGFIRQELKRWTPLLEAEVAAQQKR